MRNDSVVRRGVLVLVSVVAVLTPMPVIRPEHTAVSFDRNQAAVRRHAAWTLPRTPDGQPDLQGVWNFATATPLERPVLGSCNTTIDDPRLGQPCDLAGKEELSQAEVAEFEKRATKGGRRRQT